MLARAKLPRQGLPPRRSLAAVFGPRCIDLPVDDDVVAEHAHEGLCPGVAACGVPGVHGAAHIPGVTDASPALAEIHDAGRRPERVDRALRIAERVGQVGLDLVLVVIGERTTTPYIPHVRTGRQRAAASSTPRRNSSNGCLLPPIRANAPIASGSFPRATGTCASAARRSRPGTACTAASWGARPTMSPRAFPACTWGWRSSRPTTRRAPGRLPTITATPATTTST